MCQGASRPPSRSRAASSSVDVAARMSSRRSKDGPEMAWSSAASSELDSLSRRERASAAALRRPRAILHGEVEPEQLAEPLVLRDCGQPLVEQVLQAVVVGAD